MRLSLLFSLFFFSFGAAISAFDVPLSGAVASFVDDVLFANESADAIRIIRHPSAPFVHDGRLFYWSGYYQPTASLPKHCIFLADKLEWPFGNVTYANGTSPTGVEFGCPRNSLCRTHRCEYSFSPGAFWGMIIILSVVLGGLVYIRVWIARRDLRRRPLQDFEMNTVYVPVVTAPEVTFGGPPSYRIL